LRRTSEEDTKRTDLRRDESRRTGILREQRSVENRDEPRRNDIRRDQREEETILSEKSNFGFQPVFEIPQIFNQQKKSLMSEIPNLIMGSVSLIYLMKTFGGSQKIAC